MTFAVKDTGKEISQILQVGLATVSIHTYNISDIVFVYRWSKILALTLDKQDSQQNALKKVNELTIAQVKDIFWKERNPNMPKFLDVHPLKDVDEETLRKAQKMPKDEFGITHDNMMYNKEEDRWYCLLDAPNKEAVEKHHQKAGITCEWIKEVKTTA